MQEIHEVLREEISNLSFRKVNDDEALVSSNLLDSIAIIDLTVVIEEKFKIRISNKDINEENFDTINKIAAFIQTKKK